MPPVHVYHVRCDTWQDVRERRGTPCVVLPPSFVLFVRHIRSPIFFHSGASACERQISCPRIEFVEYIEGAGGTWRGDTGKTGCLLLRCTCLEFRIWWLLFASFVKQEA